MMEQLTLGDPMVGHEDPQTSRDAAVTVDTAGREDEVRQALRWLVCGSDTYDIQQVLAAHGMPRDRNCISRRLTSMERKGLVRRVGVKVGPHGRALTMWVLT